MTQTTARSLLDSVAQIEPIIRRYADQAETDRSLPDPAHQAMLGAGLFRMLCREVWAGCEVDVVSGFEALEAVSRIDCAAGWSRIAMAPSGMAAIFPDSTAREVFGQP